MSVETKVEERPLGPPVDIRIHLSGHHEFAVKFNVEETIGILRAVDMLSGNAPSNRQIDKAKITYWCGVLEKKLDHMGWTEGPDGKYDVRVNEVIETYA